MNLAIINSRAEVGVTAPCVQVEVHIAGGLPGLTLVGLPATAVREARDRVRAALQSSGFKIPPRRITVNLAPADLPKHGARFDLAIALGILQASGQLNADLVGMEFLGELSLSGELKPVTGVLPAVVAAKTEARTMVVPQGNAAEAQLPQYTELRFANNLLEAVAALSGESLWPEAEQARNIADGLADGSLMDFHDVKGQLQAKRALEVAVCGRHNVLMTGPPGSGKSMLAQRLPSICPELSQQEALELAAIHSTVGNTLCWDTWRKAPFRSPHHSASPAALVGGGSQPQPGEISLAHHGVLFLDELPEFKRGVLEVMREPMESGEIHISRARHRLTFPAHFQLVAAMNPCPCGYLGDASSQCHCSEEAVSRYQARISGPLFDRIDLRLRVPRIETRDLLSRSDNNAESSATIKRRVERARQHQLARRNKLNSQLLPQELEQDCKLSKQNQQLLLTASDRMQLSGRAVHRVLKVARSIADLAESETVTQIHLAESLQYRQ
ncbi:MAG: YifB family Mg chelatase-like AAA ATPase [Oceanococcus sp.]